MVSLHPSDRPSRPEAKPLPVSFDDPPGIDEVYRGWDNLKSAFNVWLPYLFFKLGDAINIVRSIG